MKKARFKVALAGFFAALALLLFVEHGQAQTITAALAKPKSAPVTYVTSPEAITLLDGQTASLKSVLGTLTPGTQAYETVETSFTYYTIILSGVISGKDVEASIQGGFQLFQNPDYVDTPTSQIQGLYWEALDLLSN